MPQNLLVDFLRAPDDIAIPKGRIIVAMLKTCPLYKGPYSDVVRSPEGLGEVVDLLESTGEAAKCRDVGKVEAYKSARLEFKRAFRNSAKHLELLADGDVSKLQGTGFDLRRPNKGGSPAPEQLGITSVTARRGKVSGVIVLKIAILLGAGGYDVQMTIYDPAMAENWSDYGTVFHTSRCEVTGLIPGQKYWFRVRAIGAHGKGGWSAPVCLIAL